MIRNRYELYVDGIRIRVIMSGWPMQRIMAELQKEFPDAHEWEVMDGGIHVTSYSDEEREFYRRGGITPDGKSV